MMNKKLNVQWFIEQHSDWEKLLSEKPYSITITHDVVDGRKLMMFKYSQIDSDFKLKLVRECRGLILDEDTNEVVCHPFDKFGNYGESYCPEIDWKSCYVTEKIDGSLIKVVKLSDDDILVSTNGTIDAFKAPIAEQIGCNAKSFGELFVEGIVNAFYDRIDWDGFGLPLLSDTVERECLSFFKANLDKGKTYMFELTSPFNKIVVAWHEVKLHFLGCRDNVTGKEVFFKDDSQSEYFNTPEVFNLRSVDECVAAAAKLDCNAEGYVVVDKDFNRVKIKSPTYVALHHMKSNGVLSYARGVDIVRRNELGEVLTYFPEFKEHLEKIQKKYAKFAKELNEAVTELEAWKKSRNYDVQPWWIENGGQRRKELATWTMSKYKKYAGFIFGFVDKKIESAESWLLTMPADKLVEYLGFKDVDKSNEQ